MNSAWFQIPNQGPTSAPHSSRMKPVWRSKSRSPIQAERDQNGGNVSMSDNSLVQGLTFRVHHTMLPVADLDRSIDFYVRLLGMTVSDRHTSEARHNEVGLLGYGDMFLELTRDTGE